MLARLSAAQDSLADIIECHASAQRRDWFFADHEDQLLDRVSVGANAKRVDQS
jgi:hypothetical protein